MKWTTLLWLLLLCSCASQRQAEKYFDQNTAKLAAYVDKNEAYTQNYGRAYAARHFPPQFYPPAVYAKQTPEPERLTLIPVLERAPVVALAPAPPRQQAYQGPYTPKTTYLQDTLLVDSLNRELEIEGLANQALRQRLKNTEADRDYWQEKNRQKFWTLIAMAVFGLLYIFFKILASRVRDT